MKIQFYVCIICFFGFTVTFGQNFSEEEAKKRFNIENLELIGQKDRVYRARSSKTDKWGLYQIDSSNEIKEILKPKYDSVSWFKGNEPFLILKNEGKYGIFLNPIDITDAEEKIVFDFEKIKAYSRRGSYFSVAKKNGKWGLVEWFDSSTILDFMYENPEEVPLLERDSREHRFVKKAKKELNIDHLILDTSNPHGIFKARDIDSGKWGMYQGIDTNGNLEFSNLIPKAYDNLEFFKPEAKITPVFNNGKVGFYLSKFEFGADAKEVIPPIYEDYRVYTAEKTNRYTGTYEEIYLALKKDGKWGWVDWFSGEKRSDFKYDSLEELPKPDW